MQGIMPMVDWPDGLKDFVKDVAVIGGGYEHDGKEIAPFDENAACAFFKKIKGNVKSIAISCVFSPVRHEHEDLCAELAKKVLGPDIHISKSSEIGSLSFIERENATILNAALYEVSESFTEGFAKSLKEEGVTNAEVYLSQNDGTLMTMAYARKYPILTIACGPTNSIRGASYLSRLQNAIVIDMGGTTTDFGVIQNGFPRESSAAVTIGGVRTNFRMPDVVSIGLGGGSIVRERDGKITVGPDSLGYLITKEALVFGGNTLTATDIAVRLGMADVGDKTLVAGIDEKFAKRTLAVITEMLEENIDKMKISSNDIDVILVGGGSIIAVSHLAGTKTALRPEYFGVANAIGSAISKVSGTYEKLVSYDEVSRDKAIENAKSEAVQMAVRAGAVPETIEIIDVEDVPLAYYAGNTSRIKIKAAGDLA
jgi:N-methylhydantoinase A/oxoprolinase/acetone carboxylase beta subunit